MSRNVRVSRAMPSSSKPISRSDDSHAGAPSSAFCPSSSPAGAPRRPRHHSRQLVVADRLGQVLVHARLQAALALALERVRGDRDDRHAQARRLLALPDKLRAAQPVHLRDLQIHQHQVKALPVQRGSAPRPLPASVTRCPAHSSISVSTSWLTALSSTSSTRSGGGPLTGGTGVRRRGPAATGSVSEQTKTYCRARLALDADLAAHHRHQARRDGQPQPRAAVHAAVEASPLGERLEDRLPAFRRDADAVSVTSKRRVVSEEEESICATGLLTDG